jgi:hypothetical protein
MKSNETPPAVAELQRLVTEQQLLEGEKQAQLGRLEDFKRDQAALLATALPDDTQAIKRLVELDLLVRLTPNGIARIDSALAELPARMAPAITGVHAEIQQRFNQNRERILARFEAALAGLVEPGDIAQAAWKAAVHSPVWRRLHAAFPEVADRAGLAGQYRSTPEALLEAIEVLCNIEQSAQAED